MQNACSKPRKIHETRFQPQRSELFRDLEHPTRLLAVMSFCGRLC
jgi:hypothetical protein